MAIRSRGDRNNNPGNIEDNDQNKALWLGEIEHGPNDDPRFLVFIDKEHGVRALVKILRGYQVKHGLKTVRQIISRYAPSSENNTAAYAAAVAAALGVKPDEEIRVDDHMAALVRAIDKHEQGYQSVTDYQINYGISMA